MKLVTRLVLSGVAVLVLAIGAFWFYIDSVVGTAIEEGGTYALGVDTRVGFVRLSLLGGSLRISSLSIDNPPGFDSDEFVTVGSARLDVDTGTLREPTVVVPLVAIDDVFVALEGKGSKSNVSAILRNLKKFESGGAKGPEPAPDEGGGTQMVISKLRITDVNALVDVIVGGREIGKLDVVIPEIALDNVGGGRPVTFAELSNIIVKAILASVLKSGGQLGALAGQLQSGLGGLANLNVDVTGAVAKPVGQALDTASQALGAGADAARAGAEAAKPLSDAAKGVGDSAGKVVRGLGGFLKRDEE